MGRPTVYTDEAAEEILRRLAEGESLTRICRDEHIPSRETVRVWVNGKGDAPETFSGDYARARSHQAESYFDEVLDAAREALEDPDRDTQATKLLTDNLKWVLARMDPGKYGDRSKVQLGGDPDAPPVAGVAAVTQIEPGALDDDDHDTLIDLAHKALQRGGKR